MQSVERAHSNMAPGRVFLTRGRLTGTSVNRSPTAYDNNPEEERRMWVALESGGHTSRGQSWR